MCRDMYKPFSMETPSPYTPTPNNQNFPTTIEVVMKKTWFDKAKSIGIGIFFVLFFLLFITGLAVTGENLVPTEYEVSYKDANFLDTYISEEHSKTQIGLIQLSGTIMPNGSSGNGITSSEYITPASVRDQIQKIKQSNVEAVLVNISSPGGAVSASDEIAHMFRELKKEIPVFFYTPDVMASGAYYIAADATKIYAQNESMVGSIGVMWQMMNYEELSNKAGVKVVTFTAGEIKDIGNPFRAMNEREQAVIQGLVDESYETFTNIVQNGRGMTREEVLTIATGEIWSGRTAATNKLIDKAVYPSELSIDIATEIGIDAEDMVYIQYQQNYSLLDSLLIANFVPSQPLTQVADTMIKKPGLYYLWY
jgi:protease-4